MSHPSGTVAPMDPDRFWELIETARATPGVATHIALEDLLAGMAPGEVIAFGNRFGAFHAALYDWRLWAAGYLVGGGCSDDAFMDFRAGVIAAGREWYEVVCASPDALDGHPSVIDDDESLFYEAMLYAPVRAYRRITGERATFDEATAPFADRVPRVGEDFDFEDDAEMRRRLPRLAARYLGAEG